MSFECTFPWTGMTIDPQGQINVCCTYRNKRGEPLGNISDVEDLEEFFLGDSYTKLRADFKDGFRKNEKCASCWKSYGTTVAHSSLPFSMFQGLQYLEITTSNVCNQSCAMCSSYASSQLIKLNPIFNITDQPTKAWSISDKDFDKILKIIPTLKMVHIKGGEPFADMKNLKIIKAVRETNPWCKIQICSNFQMIPEAFIKELKHCKRVHASASVDAIGKRFDWIRGGDFKQVEYNIDNFFGRTGVKPTLVPCVSIYNIHHLREIYDWAQTKKSVKFYEISNIVKWPMYHCAANILNQEEIDKSISDQFDDIKHEFNVDALYNIEAQPGISQINQLKRFNDTMNKVRGFSL